MEYIEEAICIDLVLTVMNPITKNNGYSHTLQIGTGSQQKSFYIESHQDSTKIRDLIKKYLVLNDINNKYLMGSKIRQGKFGSIHEIFSIEKKQKYSAKIIKKAFLCGKYDYKYQLVQEIKNQRFIDHPNIERLIEVHETNNKIVIILEFIDGKPLFDLDNMGVILKSARLNFLVHCSHVLEELSKHKIIHRNFKPENILIARKGILKVQDFGISICQETTFDSSHSPCNISNPR